MDEEWKSLKSKGDKCLVSKKCQESIGFYLKALEVLEDRDRVITSKLHTNLCLAYHELNQPQKIYESSCSSINMNPKWVKGFVWKIMSCSSLYSSTNRENIKWKQILVRTIRDTRSRFTSKTLKTVVFGFLKGKSAHKILEEAMVRVKYFTTDIFFRQLKKKKIVRYEKIRVVDSKGRGHYKCILKLKEELSSLPTRSRAKEPVSILLCEGNHLSYHFPTVKNRSCEIIGFPSTALVTFTNKTKNIIILTDIEDPDEKRRFQHVLLFLQNSTRGKKSHVMNVNIKNIRFFFEFDEDMTCLDGQSKEFDEFCVKNAGKTDSGQTLYNSKFNKKIPRRMVNSIFEVRGDNIHLSLLKCRFESPEAELITRSHNNTSSHDPQQIFDQQSIEITEGDKYGVFYNVTSTLRIHKCTIENCYRTTVCFFKKLHISESEFLNSVSCGIQCDEIDQVFIRKLRIENILNESTYARCLHVQNCKNVKIQNCVIKVVTGFITIQNNKKDGFVSDVSVTGCRFQLSRPRKPNMRCLYSGIRAIFPYANFERRRGTLFRLKCSNNSFLGIDVGIMVLGGTEFQIKSNVFQDNLYCVHFFPLLDLSRSAIQNNKFKDPKIASFFVPYEEVSKYSNRLTLQNEIYEKGKRAVNGKVDTFFTSDFYSRGKRREKKSEKRAQKLMKREFRKADGFYCSPLGQHVIIACGWCQRIEEKGVKYKRCGNCKNEYYCSVDCQKKHWKTHKKTCTVNK